MNYELLGDGATVYTSPPPKENVNMYRLQNTGEYHDPMSGYWSSLIYNQTGSFKYVDIGAFDTYDGDISHALIKAQVENGLGMLGCLDYYGWDKQLWTIPTKVKKFILRFSPDYRTRRVYYDTLSMEDNAYKYVETLKLWKSVGLFLKGEYVTGENKPKIVPSVINIGSYSTGRGGYTINDGIYHRSKNFFKEDGLPLYPYSLVTNKINISQNDKDNYTLALEMFEELALTKLIRDSFFVLDTARLLDLPTLHAVHSYAVNRMPYNIISRITSNTNIKLLQDGVEVNSVISEIPKNLSEIAIVLSVNELPFLKTVFGLGQNIPAHLDNVTIINGVPVLNAQQYLIYLYFKNIWIHLENLRKLEAKTIALTDPQYQISQTSKEFVNDPSKNPMLIFDEQKSIDAGKPVYTHMEVNESIDYNDTIKNQSVSPDSGVTLAHYMATPELRTATFRSYVVTDGLRVSQQDINANAKKGNIVPWLIAGGIGAYAVSQVL